MNNLHDSTLGYVATTAPASALCVVCQTKPSTMHYAHVQGHHPKHPEEWQNSWLYSHNITIKHLNDHFATR